MDRARVPRPPAGAGAPPAEPEASSTTDRECRPRRGGIIAPDDDGIDWIRWEGSLIDSVDDDNENANGSDNGSDDADADPELTAEHEFDCDGKDDCANVWTITTTKRGRYKIVGEVRDEIEVR